MGQGLPARKAAKSIRRKAVVASKRSAEAPVNSLSGRVRQAATLPILSCLVSDGLFECGMGLVTLMRGASRAYQHTAFFMVDSFCLGVKEVYFRDMDLREAEQALKGFQAADPASPVAPAEARKLLHDVVAWARENGFPPPPDYGRIEALFGNTVPAATDYRPRFGKDGQIVYVPGPKETPAQVRRRMKTIRSRHGDAVADQSILAIASLLAGEMDDDEYEWEEPDPVGAG